MTKKIKDKERDSIDFGKTRIEPLFNSIFYPTLLSMVFASLFTVADGIFVGQGVGSNALVFRGLVFLVPAFILMPIFIYPQGMWLAVPVAECMTLGVILLTNKGIISRY
jgi:Na+-driven multidrug efflux pump